MMRQLIGGAAAIAGVSLALLVSTPTRRSQLLWLYNKGGFYFLLRATCGSPATGTTDSTTLIWILLEKLLMLMSPTSIGNNIQYSKKTQAMTPTSLI